jgi:rhodanese-related sulfurtransferase
MTLEPFVYAAALLASSGFVVYEGARRAELDEKVGVTPRELYGKIAKSQVKLQIVDVRPDPEENYEDTHVPGAIPFPGCDLAMTPDKAKDRVLKSVPTIVVSESGDRATFDKCAAFFTSARNLTGGLDAWVEENLPEDSGEFVPPKPSAGGGCL